MLGGVTCDQITDQGVVITTKDKQRKLIEADTVMVLLSQEPDTSLLEALKARSRRCSARARSTARRSAASS